MWARLWKKPQALVWEELGMFDEVAFFVRCFVIAELPFAKAADRTVVRQLQDDLGLSITGMARHKWLIESEEVKEQQRSNGSRRGSARSRLDVIEGGKGRSTA